MKRFDLKTLIFAALSCGLIPLLSACGGPTQDSKVANAIESMMGDALSADLDFVGGRTAPGQTDQGPFQCTGSGTFSFQTGISVDPSTGSGTATTTINYDNCVIKVCDDTVTLTGNGNSELTLNVTGANVVDISLIATNQAFGGVISGNYSFSYVMHVNATTSTISAPTIDDSTTPQPLNIGGRLYHGGELNALANGC